MRIEVLMSKLFGFSTQTYFNWKKDLNNRPIISFLDKYFSKEDLLEYLNTGKISKLEVNDSTNRLITMTKRSIKDKFIDIDKDTIKYLINFINTHHNKKRLLHRSSRYNVHSYLYLMFKKYGFDENYPYLPKELLRLSPDNEDDYYEDTIEDDSEIDKLFNDYSNMIKAIQSLSEIELEYLLSDIEALHTAGLQDW